MTNQEQQAAVREDARKFVIENCLARNPVVVLGSGASVKYGLPTMGQLKDAIVAAVDPMMKTDPAKAAWEEFKGILNEKDNEGYTTDLETAMQRAKLNDHPALFNAVIDATWNAIAAKDQQVLCQYFMTGDELPLARLYRFLLKSQHRRVTVVTPNYDRLAEYAADMAGLHYRTGFGGGIIRDMRDLDRPLRYYRADLKSEERTVDIWKVHGSIDWFRIERTKGEKILNLPLGLSDKAPPSMPPFSRPVIVPPGRGKYEETHKEPYRSCMREADRALNTAGAFLCVGYGFNDSHLQECLLRRCHDKAPVVLVTYGITSAARKELIDGNANAVVFSHSGPGWTTIHTPNCRKGVQVEGPDLWDFGAFLDFVLE